MRQQIDTRLVIKFRKSWSILALLFSFLAIVVLSGCSSKRNPTSIPDTHPEYWLDPTSPDFHGGIALNGGIASCQICHGEDFNGGKVDVSCVDCHLEQAACINCHGGIDNSSGAPPRSLRGETDHTAIGVGAHSKHLGADGVTIAVACQSCHIVPAFLLDPGHVKTDGILDSIAEIAWGGLVDSSVANWDRANRTCTNIYCHGNFPGGDSTNSPVWTQTNQADCGSCHDVGADPATLLWKHQFHVAIAGLNCNACHATVVDSSLQIIDRTLHVNGFFDVAIADSTICSDCHTSGTALCTFCHGGTDNQSGAPPKGLRGEILTTDRAVGAHSKHLDGGLIANAFDCTICHKKPDSLFSPAHLGEDSIAEITWGILSGTEGIWNPTLENCRNTYCHGNFNGGNNSNAPIWTSTGQTNCGSCHDVGTQPANLKWKHDIHVNTFNIGCVECHATVVDSSLAIVGLDLHVNGLVDTSILNQALCDVCHSNNPSACVTCHGGQDNQTGAPPMGLRGETSATNRAVGAHTTHMEGAFLADPFRCTECHIVPTTFADVGHYGTDSIAEVTWGSLAGANASWDRNSELCSNVYCHGNFPGGYPANQPVWTGPGQAACGSCHDDGTTPDDMSGEHRKHVEKENIQCYQCHSMTVDSFDNIIGKSLHVDGQIQISFSSGQGTFNNGDCSNVGCHDTESWR